MPRLKWADVKKLDNSLPYKLVVYLGLFGIVSPSLLYAGKYQPKKPWRCKLGFHKWQPVGELKVDWRNKWDAYEVAKGKCDHCGLEAEIRRPYYW